MSPDSDFVRHLRGWLQDARKALPDAPVPPEVSEQIEAQLEEIRVAEEKLRVQRRKLEEALQEADRLRARYEELFRHAPVAYLTTDENGLIRDVNLAAAALLGVRPDDAAGKPLPVFIAGTGELRTRLGRLRGLEEVDDWETEVCPRDQDPIPVCISALPVASGERGAAEIRWVLRDIRSERAVAEQQRTLAREQAARAAMERVAARARQIAEASGRLMGVLDPPEVWATAAAVLDAHARAVLLVQVEKGVVTARAASGTTEARQALEPYLDRPLDPHGEVPASLALPLRRLSLVLRDDEPEVLNGLEAPGETGSSACLLVPLTSRHDVRGAAILWLRPDAVVGEELVVARTMADRVVLALETAELFQEVVTARRLAEEATAAQSDFLSVASHELRTPLTAIVSYAELLTMSADQLPEKLARYARQIAGAADHQRRLVDQVLSYKQLERGEDQIVHEELDFRKPAELAIAMARPLASGRPIEVILDMPNRPVTGRCDPGRVRQILANLLTNAIRYTEEGHVRLSMEAPEGWVVFRVEDTGEGIPEDAVPRIFNRFWRGGTTGKHQGGSGLGLTITRELVQRMHGDIAVESRPGSGTTMTVRIPRTPPEPV